MRLSLLTLCARSVATVSARSNRPSLARGRFALRAVKSASVSTELEFKSILDSEDREYNFKVKVRDGEVSLSYLGVEWAPMSLNSLRLLADLFENIWKINWGMS